MNLFIKSWAGFIETSPRFDEQIQEQLIIGTFRTTFSEIFFKTSNIYENIHKNAKMYEIG